MSKIKKIKWNFVVMQSMFGNLWIGKTKLPTKKEVIFSDIKDAIDKAKELFFNKYPEFEEELFNDEEEGNNPDQEEEFRNIIKPENELTEITKKMVKFIVGNY
jgi:hypothetical protein